jgi:polar amino acid transport system substrate-binding protein
MMSLRRPLLAAAFVLFAYPVVAQQALPPLRTGVDATFAPHAFQNLGGGLEGFQIDLFNEVARRMHRQITIEGGSFSGLIPALQAGRYDFLAAPTTVTPERAQALLFTQGYLWTDYQFGIRKGAAPLTGWDDLKGKVVVVNKGTPYEVLAKQMGDKIGFTVQVFDTTPDAVQAVVSGRAAAALAGNTVIKYAASKNPQFAADLVLTDTKAHWAAPFRKDEAELRGVMDDVLKCMKRDGTVARLSEKWFGAKPQPDDLENVTFPGHGIPNLPGYEPNAPEPDCSKYAG